MVPLSSIAAVIVFLYMLSAVLWLWRRSKIWQHPLPEPGYNIGFASLLCPFYSEISFIVRAWREAPMDFLANINNSVEMLCHTFDRDGIYRIWLGSHPFVLVYEPNAVEALLSSSEHIEKAESYSALHEWLGTGLLTSNGSKWRARRKLLTPTFHFAILEDFIEIFNRHSQQFATRLENKFGNGTKIFDIFAEAPLCTLDIICETAMGIQVNAQQDSSTSYVHAIHTVGFIFMKRITKPWLWHRFLFRMAPEGRAFYKSLDILHSFTRKVINERRMEYQTNVKPSQKKQSEVIGAKKKQAFLDLLLEKHHQNPAALTVEDIAEEVDTFMFEGHDTTAVGVSWCLFLLGHDLVWQQRVVDEIIEVVGDDPTTPITKEHLPKLKYLECVIKESQRLYPSVPLIGRRLRQDLYLKNNRVIPAGSSVVVLIMQLHRRPDLFPRPDDFIPERFLQADQDGIAKVPHRRLASTHPYAYVPFSAGPRNCIGQRFALMEEKILVANVLRRLEFRSLTRRENVQVNINLVTRATDGLKMCARVRR